MRNVCFKFLKQNLGTMENKYFYLWRVLHLNFLPLLLHSNSESSGGSALQYRERVEHTVIYVTES